MTNLDRNFYIFTRQGKRDQRIISVSPQTLKLKQTSSNITTLVLSCSRLSVSFTVSDISGFGDSSRELFIKSSCYSTIPITMSSPGPTVSWTFTSEPKSISFSVVYRERTDTPLEQAKVSDRCGVKREACSKGFTQGEKKIKVWT